MTEQQEYFKQLGDLYSNGGGEENGIFINFDEAKKCYEQAGIDFDPESARRQWRDNVNPEQVEFATFRLSGADVAAVKQFLYELCNGDEDGRPFMMLPLEIVMKALVGGDAYAGRIQSIDDEGPDSIEAEFYGCNPEVFMHALLQAFPESLNVEVI